MDFKIGIEDIGNRPHRRWLVRDSVGQYWAGKRWGSKQQALVFANSDDDRRSHDQLSEAVDSLTY